MIKHGKQWIVCIVERILIGSSIMTIILWVKIEIDSRVVEKNFILESTL